MQATAASVAASHKLKQLCLSVTTLPLLQVLEQCTQFLFPKFSHGNT